MEVAGRAWIGNLCFDRETRLADVISLERRYWSRLYRDGLGDPAWEARVNKRLRMIEGNVADVSFVRKARIEGQLRRVLSAGCGTGNFIMSWLNHGTSDSVMHGIDLDEEVLAITRSKALASDAADWVLALTPQQARRKAGMASKHFWLRKLLQNFWRPT